MQTPASRVYRNPGGDRVPLDGVWDGNGQSRRLTSFLGRLGIG